MFLQKYFQDIVKTHPRNKFAVTKLEEDVDTHTICHFQNLKCWQMT